VQAKEYLRQIETMGTKLGILRGRIKELQEDAIGVSVSNDGVRVQTSRSGDKLSDAVIKYVELEALASKQEVELQELKSRITSELFNLTNPQHIKVLYKRYVDCKCFELIAVEMSMSLRNVLRIHGYALQEFTQCSQCCH